MHIAHRRMVTPLVRSFGTSVIMMFLLYAKWPNLKLETQIIKVDLEIVEQELQLKESEKQKKQIRS